MKKKTTQLEAFPKLGSTERLPLTHVKHDLMKSTKNIFPAYGINYEKATNLRDMSEEKTGDLPSPSRRSPLKVQQSFETVDKKMLENNWKIQLDDPQFSMYDVEYQKNYGRKTFIVESSMVKQSQIQKRFDDSVLKRFKAEKEFNKSPSRWKPNYK